VRVKPRGVMAEAPADDIEHAPKRPTPPKPPQ
jgi:hypothetical protein